MKKIVALMILYLLVVGSVQASVSSGHQIIESKMSESECLEKSKSARKSIVKDSFGEFVEEGSYTYISENANFTVLCLPEKESIVIFIAVDEGDALTYLSIFYKHIVGKLPDWAN